MRTVGEILVEARKKKNLTLEQVEKETRIRKKVLRRLEEGDWSELSPTYAKGLLKNYASYLGLDEKRIIAFFRREYDGKKEKATTHLEKLQPRFRFTPTAITVFLIGILVLGVVAYLFFQYQSFTAAPRLEIEEPKDNIKISSPEVNVVGKTWNDVVLKINGEKIQVSPGGTFSVSVSLKEGINKLTITAENRFGKINTKLRTVIVETDDQTKVDTNEGKGTVTLQLRVPNKSVFLEIAVDGKSVFRGLMLVGSSKIFEGKDKIRVISEDAGETLVKIDGDEFPLGEKGEKIEREFKVKDAP
ncbi:helix-turn-helix domain-containing protein [Patescibacteria group bacterium]|nr:helix-turn-helix domain-containing protein [Patescibacteria group bacterium]